MLQYTLLQHPLSIKDNASTSSDILLAASHATAAAVLMPGSTSTHMKVNVAATFGQKMSPVWSYFTKLHRRTSRSCTGGSVRGTNEGKNVMLPTSPRRQEVECLLYTHNSTKALIRHLHKASYYIIPGTPEAICRNVSYERSCFGG